METWETDYTDSFEEGPYILRRLFQRQDGYDTFAVLKLVLDKVPQFLQDYYRLIPDYQDGLDFVDFAHDIIKEYGRGTPMERLMRWDICLVSLKLEMLDKLGKWREYRDFYDDMYKKHPNYRCAYEKKARHLQIDRADPYLLGEDRDFYYVHFLYLLLPRYEAINKYLETHRKTPIKRKPPKINEKHLKEDYISMKERLDTLLGIDANIIKKYEF